MSTTIPPASSLLRSFERADAALSLAAGKLEAEAGDTFTGAHARLNPARLLRRLSALEAELPKLKEAAARNASARAVLGTLHATINNNQQEALGLARRAHAPVEADADARCCRGVGASRPASLPVAPPRPSSMTRRRQRRGTRRPPPRRGDTGGERGRGHHRRRIRHPCRRGHRRSAMVPAREQRARRREPRRRQSILSMLRSLRAPRDRLPPSGAAPRIGRAHE